MEQKERLIEILSRYFQIGDSYAYNLTRDKEAFSVGTMDLDDFEEFDEVTVADIAEYLTANGVIVPPCKVGQSVFLVFTPKYPANPSNKGKWFLCQDGVQRIIYGAKGLSIETWNMGTIPEKEIGKKLFFDKAEAEKALAERSET